MDYIIIVGKTKDGHRFRPTNWNERLANIYSEMDEYGRGVYNRNITPCIIDGVTCLLIRIELEKSNNEGWNHIIGFCIENNLLIIS